MATGKIQDRQRQQRESDAAGRRRTMAAAGGAGEQPPPDQGRYLQKDGTILPAGTSQEQQFKRLPVYLKLVMDQREIHSAAHRVRELSLAGRSAAIADQPERQRVRPAAAAQQVAAPAAPKPGEAYDVTVEIHGIIYLFNPPDPAKLGTGTAETQAAG